MNSVYFEVTNKEIFCIAEGRQQAWWVEMKMIYIKFQYKAEVEKALTDH